MSSVCSRHTWYMHQETTFVTDISLHAAPARSLLWDRATSRVQRDSRRRWVDCSAFCQLHSKQTGSHVWQTHACRVVAEPLDEVVLLVVGRQPSNCDWFRGKFSDPVNHRRRPSRRTTEILLLIDLNNLKYFPDIKCNKSSYNYHTKLWHQLSAEKLMISSN